MGQAERRGWGRQRGGGGAGREEGVGQAGEGVERVRGENYEEGWMVR